MEAGYKIKTGLMHKVHNYISVHNHPALNVVMNLYWIHKNTCEDTEGVVGIWKLKTKKI